MKAVAFGECMIEICGETEQFGRAEIRYGGDSLNVATYMSRLGLSVQYLTALGNDPFSTAMENAWRSDGIGCDLILHHPTRAPGLYIIRNDDVGERSFHYWRGESAARHFFECAGLERALERAAEADLLYLSGITLSLFSDDDQQRIIELCQGVRARRGTVAFDPNYRAQGWTSRSEARRRIDAFAPVISICLPTFDDEAKLYGDATPLDSHARWRAAGVEEVAVKLGPRGVLVVEAGSLIEVPVEAVLRPVDTTGAGDAFNAAYLAARMKGLGATVAANHGNRLAGIVVQHAGAILPDQAIPNL